MITTLQRFEIIVNRDWDQIVKMNKDFEPFALLFLRNKK